MKVYYAHCVQLYDTPQEQRDVELLEQLGWTVANPNTAECAEGYRQFGMEYFCRFGTECAAVAFRSLPDGSIPAGVLKELQMFQDMGKPVLELPSGLGRRGLTVDQTREYLRECGQR